MRYKLNMLEPASKIFRVIFTLGAFSAIFYIFKHRGIAIVFSVAALVFIILVLIGVVIELKQDNILFNRHNQLRNEAKFLGNTYECEYCVARFKTKLSFCPQCGKSLKYNRYR